MTWTQIILILGAIPLLVGYLFGSVNFGVVVSRLLYHEDIRTKGSGNAGTTNILRTYGKKAAALTLAGDMLKGVAAVVLCRWAGMLLTGGVEVNGIYAGYLAAIGAVCGHLWPVWFGFKGGKGVAVAAGAILPASRWCSWPWPWCSSPSPLPAASSALPRSRWRCSIPSSPGFTAGTPGATSCSPLSAPWSWACW